MTLFDKRDRAIIHFDIQCTGYIHTRHKDLTSNTVIPTMDIEIYKI